MVMGRIVRSSLGIRVKHTLSHRDMTPREKQNARIQEYEAESILRQCHKIIKEVEEQYVEY